MTPLSPLSTASPAGQDKVLRSLADNLESQFLAEMLKSAGLAKPPNDFGGGAGEAQFSSFLTAEYADATVAAGGIGLSEAIYRSLVARKETA